jgi:hypothetical protein
VNIAPLGTMPLFSFSKYLSLHLINISSWNHGKKNDSPYILYNMNNMLPLQYASAANAIDQPGHRSIVSRMIRSSYDDP